MSLARSLAPCLMGAGCVRKVKSRINTSATRQSHLLARGSLALAMTLVGSSVVSAKFMVEQFPIFLGLGIRQVSATLIMFLIVLLAEKQLPRMAKRDHGIILLQTITGVVIFNVLMLAGVDRTTAAASGIITSTVPAWIALLSLVLGERISRLTMIGIGLAMGGVLVVNVAGGDGGSDRASAPLLGGVLVMGAVIGEALFTVCGKALAGRVTPLANCFMVCVYGSLMFLPIALWQLPGFDFGTVAASGWIALAWSAGPVMIGAFFLWFTGLKFVPANSAAVYTGLIPVSALVCSAIFLGERIGWPHLAGMACVVAAIVLVARPDRTVMRLPGEVRVDARA
ncbi:MAG: DMT family transporter [Chloroflexota bacterium]|nr:DMT family transporter [Chloroflexota bacterium]